MKDEQELKMCPFCGDAHFVGEVVQGEPGHEDKWIQCTSCDATAPTWEAWNKRADAAKDKRVEELEELVAGVINLLEAGDLSRDSQCHIARDLRNEILPQQSPEEEQ